MSEEAVLDEIPPSNEPETESISNIHSLSVTTLTESSVNLQWKYVPSDSDSDPTKVLVYKLVRLEARGEWKSIAWTRQMSCIVKNLEQNVCYSLKLLVLVEKENEFEIVDETDVFKASIFATI